MTGRTCGPIHRHLCQIAFPPNPIVLSRSSLQNFWSFAIPQGVLGYGFDHPMKKPVKEAMSPWRTAYVESDQPRIFFQVLLVFCCCFGPLDDYLSSDLQDLQAIAWYNINFLGRKWADMIPMQKAALQMTWICPITIPWVSRIWIMGNVCEPDIIMESVLYRCLVTFRCWVAATENKHEHTQNCNLFLLTAT